MSTDGLIFVKRNNDLSSPLLAKLGGGVVEKILELLILESTQLSFALKAALMKSDDRFPGLIERQIFEG